MRISAQEVHISIAWHILKCMYLENINKNVFATLQFNRSVFEAKFILVCFICRVANARINDEGRVWVGCV